MSNQPYIGLRPFERNETDIFFGRETHSDELINRLGSNHFLAVIGTSGCGKSSLVKTGLIAGLEAGYLAKAGTHWHIVEMRPGQQPFQALAGKLLAELKAVLPAHETVESLADKLRQGSLSLHELLAQHPLPNHAQLLIVCDQFEEIFRYFQHGEAAEARNFVSLLLASSKPYPLTTGVVSNSLYVVITMRSDFLGDCAQFAGLAEAINSGLYLTPRLDAQQLRAAIEEPAFVFGGEVEPALVTQLLEDAGNNPDQLPLLQHVLMVMWRFAKKQPTDGVIKLDLATYEKAGKLKNALSQHADVIFEQMLSAEQQRIAEVLFRNLTENDDRLRDTRRPVLLSEVAELAGVQWQQVAEVVKDFRENERCFLSAKPEILTPESLLDISHESLIRQWQRLKNWVKDEAQAAELYRHLLESALRYRNKQVGLLQSPELDIMLQWQKNFQPTASWAKRYGKYAEDFDKALAFLAQSAKRQRLKKVAYVLLLLVMTSLAGVASWKWKVAENYKNLVVMQANSVNSPDSIDANKKADLLQKTIGLLEKEGIDSNDKELQSFIAYSSGHLANIYLSFLPDNDKSLLYAKKAMLLFEEIVKKDPNNIIEKKRLLITYKMIGEIYLKVNEADKALSLYQQTLKISEQIAKQDPNNSEAQRDLFVSFINLGNLEKQRKNKAAAKVWFEKALPIAQKLAEDKMNYQAQQDLKELLNTMKGL